MDVENANRLVAARDFAAREEIPEARDAAEVALALCTDAGDTAGGAEALRILVSAEIGLGHAAKAKSMAEVHLSRYRKAGDDVGTAQTLVALAMACQACGGVADLQNAISAATEARSFFRSQGNIQLEAASLVEIANAHVRSKTVGYESNALFAIDEASPLLDACGDQKARAVALHTRAVVMHGAGDVSGCIQAATEASSIFADLGLDRLHAIELRCLSRWHLADEQPTEAASAARQAVDIFVRLGDAVGEQLARENCLNALMAADESTEALEIMSNAVSAARFSGDHASEAASLECLVSVHLGRVDMSRAVEVAGSARAAFEAAGDRAGVSRMIGVLAQLEIREEKFEKAAETSQQAVASPGIHARDRFLSLEALLVSQLAQQNCDSAEKTLGEFSEGSVGNAAFQRACEAISKAAVLAGRKDYRQSLKSAEDARALLAEAGEAQCEASCLHLQARLRTCLGEHMEAMAAAECARTLVRSTGEIPREIGALLLSAQTGIAALAQGARGGDKASVTFLSGRGRDRVLKAAQQADGLATKCGNDPLLQATCLHVLARALAANGDIELSLEKVGESAALFRRADDARGEAGTMLLNARVQAAMRKSNLAVESVREALKLYRSANDLVGEVESMDLLAELTASSAPTSSGPAPSGNAGLGDLDTELEQKDVGSEGMPPAANRSIPTDIMALPLEERVKHSVTELVLEAIGRDDLEEDVTLMETGMTSIASIMLRDRLQNEFPDIEEMDLTFVFDYPTIREITDFIVDALPPA